MGLSIHYTFNAGNRSTVEVLNIMTLLRDQAQRLGFYEVDAEVANLREEQCSFNNLATFLSLVASRVDPITAERQMPTQIIGFIALPRPGSESLPIFLAQYPDSQTWISSGHCKTIFAGLPKYGGTANFVLAHIMVIEVLSQAQQLGIVESIFDESSYWEKRNLLCLADKTELMTLSDDVGKQPTNMSPDFIASILRQIKSAIK